MKNEFVQSAEDHCFFRCDGTNGSQLFVLVSVDDILYFSNNDKVLHDFKVKFTNAFSIDDRKKMTSFLRRNVESQQSFIKNFLRKSHKHDCEHVSTPAIPHTKQKQSKSDSTIEGSENSLGFCEQTQYLSLVGIQTDCVKDKGKTTSRMRESEMTILSYQVVLSI